MVLGEHGTPVRTSLRTRLLRIAVSAELLVFFLALAARLVRNLIAGGFTAPSGYDPSVYYAAASGIVNGRVPYRDFTLVHPPGMALLESPFALLGRLTTDMTGYVGAQLEIITLASLAAVLVVRVAGAMGLSRRAAITGGLAYALWTNAVAFEFVGRLEPVGNFFLLVGLLALLKGDAAEGRWSTRLRVLAGLAFGAAVCIKLWWILPVLALLAWRVVADRKLRETVPVLVGGAVTLVAINLPFFLVARSKMWDNVVLDQLNRAGNTTDHHTMLSYLVAGWWSGRLSTAVAWLCIAAGGALLVWAGVRAWRWRTARPVLVLLVVQLLQLWFQPIWYPFYADFTTVALCLTIAAAVAAPEPAPARRPWVPWVVVGALALNTTAFLVDWSPGADASPTPFPRTALIAAVADARCVMSDQPMAQIELNVLTRSFQDDCENWVDVIGRRLRVTRVQGPPSVPGTTLIWNKLFAKYLASGDVIIFMRPPEVLGLTPRYIAKLKRGGVLVEVGGYTVFRTPRR